MVVTTIKKIIKKNMIGGLIYKFTFLVNSKPDYKVYPLPNTIIALLT